MRIHKFVIISPNDLIRYGICSLLEHRLEPEARIITVSSIQTYLKNKEDTQELIFLDDDLPQHQPILKIIRQIKTKNISTKLIIMGSFLSVSYIQKIINSDADGYIYKQDHLGQILHLAVKTIQAGQIFLSPRASALPYESKQHEVLNKNDMEVLVLLAEGGNVQDIARRLNLVDRSIYRIRTRIRNYLGVSNNE